MMQKIESKKRLSKSRKSIAFDRTFSLAGGMFYQPINRSQKSNDASQFAEIQQMIAVIILPAELNYFASSCFLSVLVHT